MSKKRFERWNDCSCKVKDNQEGILLRWEDVVKKLNGQQATISQLKQENEKLQKQIQNYERLIDNAYVGEEETLDGLYKKCPKNKGGECED